VHKTEKLLDREPPDAGIFEPLSIGTKNVIW